MRARLGDQAHWLDELPRPLFDRLFAWRSRLNCFLCFYQALYEWIGLHDHHPDLFWRSVAYEEQPLDRRETAYHWRSDYSLREVLAQRERIIEKRVRYILAFLYKRAKQPLPLDLEPVTDEFDGLAVTSCGLLCGK